jgi:hypothetical protein
MSFQLVRRDTVRKNVGGPHDDFIVGSVEEKYAYRFIDRAVIVVNIGGEDPYNPAGSNIYVTENGDGVVFGQEVLGIPATPGDPPTVLAQGPQTKITTTWNYETDGTIISEEKEQLQWEAGYDVFAGTVGGFRFGLRSERYKSKPQEEFGDDRETITTTYSQIDEDTYSVSQTTETGADTTHEFSSGTGARPQIERIRPVSSSEEMRFTFTDAVRTAISGTITEEIHNEYCESPAELRTATLARVRELSGMKIVLPMPIESSIHKDMWVAADVPEIGLDASKKLYVWGVTRNFGKFTQSLDLRYYPPEVQVV